MGHFSFAHLKPSRSNVQADLDITPPIGTARFSCSNDEQGRVRIESEGHLIGTGSGNSSFGPVEMVFGYSIWEVNNRLTFPEGKVLHVHNRGILLDYPNAR